jgi:hypothetical protein
MTSHPDPSWTFVRYATVGGWLRVAMYRTPDGQLVCVRL